MSSSSTRTPLKRKATRQSYTDDQQPSDIDMSDGEQQKTRAKRQVNKRSGSRKAKGKGKAKKSTSAELSDEGSDEKDQLDSDSDAEGPIKKKAKRTSSPRKTSKGKGKQRGVDKLSNLPVELLTEIFGNVTPLELLILRRTSKGLRSFVDSSSSLWGKSRRSAGLPDLSAGDVTEKEYARLIYGIQCEMCDHGKVVLADFYLRKSLCKACRKQKPWQTKQYAFLPELEELSKKLYELEGIPVPAALAEIVADDLMGEDEDEDDEEEKLLREIMEDTEINFASTSTRTRQTRRPSHFSGASTAVSSSPMRQEQEQDQDQDDDEADTSEGGSPKGSADGSEDDSNQGGALAEFISDREKFIVKAKADGKRMFDAAVKIASARRLEQVRKKETHEALGVERREAIEARILVLGEYTEADFTGAWYTSKVINAPEAVTDENWETVKPKVIKLLERIKKNEEKMDVVSNQEARKGALRERYDKLLNIQPNKASRHALPLFSDFLHLDSVKPLWELEDAKPEDDNIWAEHLEGILEELDDYSISVRVRAVQMILGATTDIEQKELDGDADDFGPENFDDDWLKFPTSFLVCPLPGCRIKYRYRYDHARGNYTTTGRGLFFGSLFDLLHHQHEHHPDFSVSDRERERRQKENIVGHFTLEPEIVSALSAVISVGGLDDDSATAEDLLAITRGNERGMRPWQVRRSDAYLEWENAPGSKKEFGTYLDLIDQVDQQVGKARKGKNKHFLELPTIALHDKVADRQATQAQHEKRRKESAKRQKEQQRKKARRAKRGSRPWDVDSD